MLDFIELLKIKSLSNKYTDWYVDIISNALNRFRPKNRTREKIRKEAKLLFGYIEGHHILPKCICSTPDQISNLSNYAYLTAREHFICHWLLTKMFEDKQIYYKMENALSRFIQNSSGQRILTSRQYARARLASSLSAGDRGKKNKGNKRPELSERNKLIKPAKGSKWYHDSLLENSYMLKPDDPCIISMNLIEGRLTSKIKGTKHYHDVNGKNYMLLTSDPKIQELHLIEGMKINIESSYPLIVCPHCNKSGRRSQGMYRFHFDNCKFRYREPHV